MEGSKPLSDMLLDCWGCHFPRGRSVGAALSLGIGWAGCVASPPIPGPPHLLPQVDGRALAQLMQDGFTQTWGPGPKGTISRWQALDAVRTHRCLFRVSLCVSVFSPHCLSHVPHPQSESSLKPGCAVISPELSALRWRGLCPVGLCLCRARCGLSTQRVRVWMSRLCVE